MKTFSSFSTLIMTGAMGLLLSCVFSSSALAQCPSSLTPPWSFATTLSGGQVSSTAGGLDASPCRLTASLGASLASQAALIDQTPANENRYRFQFLINPDALGAFGNLDSVMIFSANGAAPYPASGGSRQILRVALVPGGSGAKRIIFVAACDNPTANYRCTVSTPNIPSGTSRLEVDLNVNANGNVRYWLNAPAGSSEPSPTGTLTLTGGNAGWQGVDTAALGLAVPSPSFRDNHAQQPVSIDGFNSHRTTYIGY